MAIRKILPDPRKAILKLTALAIVVSGLFPPWLYVFDKTGTSDRAGGHSEWSAGCHLILAPPRPVDAGHFWLQEQGAKTSENDAEFAFRGGGGIKLDLSRLAVEWVCILALGGAAWGLARLDKEPGPGAG